MRKANTELLYAALGEPEPLRVKQLQQDICCFCGQHNGIIAKKDIFSGGFTNWDLARMPQSQVLCKYCAIVLKTRELRVSSWLAWEKGIRYFKRNEAAGVLFSQKSMPFLLYITTSFKKLGQIKAPINYDNDTFIVQFEEIQATVNLAIAQEIYKIMRLFYSIPAEEEHKKQPKSFFTKEEIRTGQYKYNRIKNFGRGDWWEKEQQLRQWRDTSCFKLLIYVLNQEKQGRKMYAKGKVKQPAAGNNAGREGNDGKRSHISNMEVDKLGQRKWF